MINVAKRMKHWHTLGVSAQVTRTSIGAPDKVKAFRPVWGALERNLPLQGGQALSFDSKH